MSSTKFPLRQVEKLLYFFKMRRFYWQNRLFYYNIMGYSSPGWANICILLRPGRPGYAKI